MSQDYVLQAHSRPENCTKGYIKKKRLDGEVPAIVYGGSQKNEEVFLEKKIVEPLSRKHDFCSQVFSLQIGDTHQTVLAKSIQRHPVSSALIHIDFMRIQKDTRITVLVPVRFINAENAPGIKMGGFINSIVSKVPLYALCRDIPREIVVDLSNAKGGQAIRIRDLSLPSQVVSRFPDNQIVATVASSRVSTDKQPGSQEEAAS